MGRYNTYNLNLFAIMKKLLLTCFVLLGLQLSAQIETGTVGAGLSLGSPSGFSFKPLILRQKPTNLHWGTTCQKATEF